MSTCELNKSECNEIKSTITNFENKSDCQLNETHVLNPMVNNASEDLNYSDETTKTPLLSLEPERTVSPISCILHETFADPQSPSSSSSTSQTTSANDATFEPTIEMMVNDFDDEQTLNEEEALASFESQDPDEEINTLRTESEIPLEELLAKYRALPPPPTPPSLYSEPMRKKSKKSHKEKQKQKHKEEFNSTHDYVKNHVENITCHKVSETSKYVMANEQQFASESCNMNRLLGDEISNDDGNCCSNSFPSRKPFDLSELERKEASDKQIKQTENTKVRRSHLLDLYPEGTFDNVGLVNNSIAGNCQETIYGVHDDEEDEEIEEEDDDYKKKVMIGTSYQATIPIGLSQYGDILPYENEDKLIWEPCQVSEREVEEYLIKIRDIKSNQPGEEDEHSVTENNSENQLKENGKSEKNIDNLENNSFLANRDNLFIETAAYMDMDNPPVVKDNEQALHLLVQCGYDFKEALRRKRLNALPLNDCMSLWSEEECNKFEEGIQKYGKDFLKIRQNQVRTRTMRELVQFYYLWKKSERRDQNFANADTVDHMDIYLNEENEYGSSPASVLTPLGSPVGNTSNWCGTVRNNSIQKNISIMTANSTSEKNGSKICPQQHQPHHKKRTHTSNQATLNVMTTDSNSENMSTSCIK